MTDQVTISRELLPCPFCGGEAKRLELEDGVNFGGSVIACCKCDACTRVYFGEKEGLVQSWNTRSALAAPAQDGWIPVSERLPEGTVLAYYTNSHGKGRRIRARYVKRFTQESEDIDNFDAQYDEETDTYYDAEGWYELLDNWGDYSSVAVFEGEVTHWAPLPPPPKESK